MATNTVGRYEEDSNDQPVDYSKKYTERNVLRARDLRESEQAERATKKEFRHHESKVDLFSDYAETDLDQPTDYSLRYAEDDTDEDEKQNTSEYFSENIQEDTVKTYCTEGTPYETPFNFSTATSMSDLRVEDGKENDLLRKVPKKLPVEVDPKNATNFEDGIPQLRDKPQIIISKQLENKENTVNLNPGQVTPEKPINYYEEGTPSSFSRANSFSSLNSAVGPQNNKSEVTSKIDINDSVIKVEHENIKCNISMLNNKELSIATGNVRTGEKSHVQIVDKEGKMVTFGGEDYYAEETPLMFSRCSSLGSLSGFEQHSIHDDRSSIISDFSRRTSGIVSPSELPDSPTQTVPPSPRTQKIHNADYINRIHEEGKPLNRQLVFPKQITKRSVFEDDIATFKEESTPIEFSTATSLSSLTIDDEIKISDNTKKQNKIEVPVSKEFKKDIPNVDTNNSIDMEKDQEQVSDGDEDDEDMLAACISMGMQNNRYRQSFKTISIQKPVHSEPSNELPRYQRTSGTSRLEPHTRTNSAQKPVTNSQKPSKAAMEVLVVPDTMHVYCTEDTPADISPVGSQSNLSALSMPSVPEDIEKTEGDKLPKNECHRNDLSDESSNLSGEDEKILNECIQSGIPKLRQITPPPSYIPFTKNSEVIPQKFNLCGTPLSSPVECRHNSQSNVVCKPLCHRSLDHENELSDDSTNHSEDEAILTECIQSAMPKARLSASPFLRLPGSKPAELSMQKAFPCNSVPHPSRGNCVKDAGEMLKKTEMYDDNGSLSEEEEEDIMLAQCIRSGMPKALHSSSNTDLPISRNATPGLKPITVSNNLPSYHANKSYPNNAVALKPQATYKAVRNELPECLTINTPYSVSHLSSKTQTNCFEDVSLRKCTNTLQNISISGCSTAHRTQNLESEQKSFRDKGTLDMAHGGHASNSKCSVDYDEDDPNTAIDKSIIAPSRHSSVSSLSEEGSLGSIEDWALLELCITSGMPRNKCRVQTLKSNESAIKNDECQSVAEDSYSVCSYNSYVCKT